MAAVLTEIIFIYLLAWMCCVQGLTPTGMLHDSTYIPFVQCSATFTTELALSVNMQEVVNNVSLVSLSITKTEITCSIYNNFSLCANHTSDSSKIFTVKIFFPSELPRNANQFECSVTGLYTNGQTYNNKYFVNVTFESTTSTLTFTNPSTLSSSSATETGSVTPLPEHDCPKDRTVTVIVLAVLLAIFILISIIFIITTIILIRRLKGNSDKRKETNLTLSETAPPNKYENVKNTKNNLSASSKTKSPSLKLEVDFDDNGYASTTGSSASTSANSGYSEPWNSDRLPVKPSPSLVRIKGFERKDNDLVKPSPGLVHHEGFERKDNDHVDEQEVCTESTPTKF